MTRSHKYDTFNMGIGKVIKKITKKNPIESALLEFEHMDTGLGQLPKLPFQIPFLPQQQKAPVVPYAPKTLPMARPRSALEVQTQAAAAEKPGLVEQAVKPFIQVAVLGIVALTAVKLIPSILEHFGKEKRTE